MNKPLHILSYFVTTDELTTVTLKKQYGQLCLNMEFQVELIKPTFLPQTSSPTNLVVSYIGNVNFIIQQENAIPLMG
jgi:hypothetical protein